MPIPSNFIFSQSSLQDFIDCPRRFELRYLNRLRWPALQSEPALEREQHMKAGQAFHQMVNQFFCGVSAEQITAQVNETGLLAEWWRNFLDVSWPEILPAACYPEFTLHAPLAGFQIQAKYDLLAVEPAGQWLIFDWKTLQTRPKRLSLQSRMQTRVYPLLAVLAGKSLNGGQDVLPENVEMVYWFPGFPDTPERFRYHAAQLEQDLHEISQTILQIQSLDPDKFTMTPLEKQCSFCEYRSLCNRGEKAGQWDDTEDAFLDDAPLDLPDISLDQVGEIEF